MSQSRALFDIDKLNDISKDVIAKMNSEEVYDLYLKWAEEFDKEIAELITKYHQYTRDIFNIEREIKNYRKDLSKWSEVRDYIAYFKGVYKKDKASYKGSIADVTTIIRAALTNKSRTQDLYEKMQVMGEERVISRIKGYI